MLIHFRVVAEGVTSEVWTSSPLQGIEWASRDAGLLKEGNNIGMMIKIFKM